MSEPLRNEKGETLEEFLAHYDPDRYPHPSYTVDIILMTVSNDELKVLLVKRRNHPFIGDWATPGGFVEFHEDLEAAVQRELAEETSITDPAYFEQLYTLGKADRDPRTRVITTVYLTLTPESNVKGMHAADDAADAAWFSIHKETQSMDDQKRVSILRLDSPERDVHMAYEITDRVKRNYIETDSHILDSSNAKLAADHIKALNMAMDEMQHRAASTGIIFNLLPEEVTMLQIQKAYEAVTGRKVQRANFRRDMSKMLVETGHTVKYLGRDVKLFRFNPLYRFL